MATPTTKSVAVEAFLDSLTGVMGRTRREAITGNVCVDTTCNGPATEFRDALSAKEYRISGLCQTCQDGVFGTSEEDE